MNLSGLSRLPTGLLLGIVAFLMLVEVGCARKIGDSCSVSTDCSVTGDRLCDTTQPGGYCTIFNCEPDKCPDGEGVCVAFTDDACDGDGVPDPHSARFQRTFCMKGCESDGDCREGYVCADGAIQKEIGARVVDLSPSTNSICMVRPAQAVSQVEEQKGVCDPSDASFPFASGPSEPDGAAGDAPGERAPETGLEDAASDTGLAPDGADAPAD
jgi:hypothetical protein